MSGIEKAQARQIPPDSGADNAWIDPVLGRNPMATLKGFLMSRGGLDSVFTEEDFIRWLGPDDENEFDDVDLDEGGEDEQDERREMALSRKVRGTVQERARRAMREMLGKGLIRREGESYRLAGSELGESAEEKPRFETAVLDERPQGTPEEKLIESVVDIVSVFDIDQHSIDALDEKIGSQALRAVDVMVHDAVAEKVRALGLSEELTTKAIRAMTLKDWSGIEPNSKLHRKLREGIASMNTVKHALVKNWLTRNEKHTGFSEVEHLEYKHLIPALSACDQLFIKVAGADQPIDSDERVRRGFTNPWALTVMEDDQVREVSFNEAFPDEMNQMRAAYDTLLTDLYQLWSRPPGALDGESARILALKIAYYEEVAHALKTGKAEDWFRADEKLPQQGGANVVLLIHPIEDGYMEDRIIRAPEISLRAPDLDAKRAADICKETQGRMIRSLQNGSFNQLPSLVASIDLVTRSSATPRHFFGSGMEMDLKPAGQILPNDLEARIKGGVDTSLDRQSAEERYTLLKSSFESVFGEGSHDEIIGTPDFDDIIGGDIASHEFGHAVGLVPDLFNRIDKTLLTPYIEEWKATTGGLILGYWLPYKEGVVDVQKLRHMLLDQIMTAARYSAGRGHAYAKAYYRHSVMLMNTAEKAGVLKKNEGNSERPWAIDASSDENVLKFYELLEAEYRTVLDIYASGSNQDLRAFLEEKLHTTEFIDLVAERVDAMLGQAGNDTPAECLALPR